MAVTRKRKAESAPSAIKNESAQSNAVKAESQEAVRLESLVDGKHFSRIKRESQAYAKPEPVASASQETKPAPKSEEQSHKLEQGSSRESSIELAPPPKTKKGKSKQLGPFPDMKRPLSEECRVSSVLLVLNR